MSRDTPRAISVTKPSIEDRVLDRYLGALLGAAIADALGWITEFRKSRSELAKIGVSLVDRFLTWSKPTGGRFHTYIDYVSEGEYSDDTQLLLCTARSLEPDGHFNPDRFAEELRAWLDYARGAGAAITAAARNLRGTSRARWDSNFYKTRGRAGRRGYVDAGGNGAAMRVAPHALANRHDAQRTAEGVWQNAITTHGHPRAIVGSLTIAECVRLLAAVDNLTKKEIASHLTDFVEGLDVPARLALDSWQSQWEKEAGRPFRKALDEAKREMKSMLRVAGDTRPSFERTLSELGCFTPATKGSGTGCVAAAINAFLREPFDYRKATLRIVNTLGADTDTIGSMYGALVGVRMGSTRIPDVWATRMQDYEYFISVAEALTKIGLRDAAENYLRVDVPMVRKRESSDIIELTRERRVTKNQRVLHYLLGPGWVQAVHEQRTRSGGRMLLADVSLDSGQSVRFRSFRADSPPKERDREAELEGGGRPQASLFDWPAGGSSTA